MNVDTTTRLRETACDAQRFACRTDLTPDQRVYAKAIDDVCAWLAGDGRPSDQLREVMPWIG